MNNTIKTETSTSHPHLIDDRDLHAVAEWLTGEDTGLSSKYMAAVAICGRVLKSSWYDATPSDASDLGRCVRLVEKCPAIRDTFPVLRQASKVWAAYIDHWDELVALYKQGNYANTTKRMRELRALFNDFSWRVLQPQEEVMPGDRILLVGNSWITAQKTECDWPAKGYIEVRRPNPTAS